MSQNNLPDLPNVVDSLFQVPSKAQFDREAAVDHAPRIPILYGSLRQRSFSRFLALEAARLLETMGCEVKVFHSDGLPLPDGEPETHEKVKELRELAIWSEGMV